MIDVVRRFHPEPGLFSWWDYRAGNFHKNLGMRIDHVYVTQGLAARAVAAERDRDARKPSTYPGSPPTTPRSSSTSPTAEHQASGRISRCRSAALG